MNMINTLIKQVRCTVEYMMTQKGVGTSTHILRSKDKTSIKLQSLNAEKKVGDESN